ncbi:hypothetical protein ACVWY3_004850 [Bradyrhizobium sp. USDA 4486]
MFGVEVGDRRIAIYNIDGQFFATNNVCARRSELCPFFVVSPVSWLMRWIPTISLYTRSRGYESQRKAHTRQ